MAVIDTRVFLDKVPAPPPEEIEAAVKNLREWLEKEPHLPRIDDDEWLKTFFYNNKFSLKKTKSKIENYYSLRNKYPNMLKNRDPRAPWIADYLPYMSISSKLTADGARLFLIKYNLDMDKFDVDKYFKCMTMTQDLLMLEKDRLTSYLLLIDLQNFTYQHFIRICTRLKAAVEIFEKAYTERIEAVYLFNTPSITDLAIRTFLPLFPVKYADRVFVNTASNNKFLERFHEKDLPSDLGGKGASWAEGAEWLHQKALQYTEWFLEQDNITSNERLRRKEDKQQPGDLIGSFRKLEVD